MTYIRSKDNSETRPLEEKAVLSWGNGAVVFRCACGKREVYVKQPPHVIIFDEQNRLTIEGSCLKESPEIGICHFHMREGEITMCADSTCQ